SRRGRETEHFSGSASMKDQPILSRTDLQAVAGYQKGILLCILVYAVAVLVQFALPDELRLAVGLGILGLGVVATVFVFLLATKVYSTGTGIFLGIVTFLPCIG